MTFWTLAKLMVIWLELNSQAKGRHFESGLWGVHRSVVLPVLGDSVLAIYTLSEQPGLETYLRKRATRFGYRGQIVHLNTSF